MMWRFRFVLVLLIGAFFLIISRLFYWQIVKAEELSSIGESQYGQSIKVTPIRGEIKTSDLFPIATNKLAYLVFGNPREIKEEDKDKLISLLPSLLEIPKATVSSQLSKNLLWVPLKSSIDNKTKEQIDSLKLPGIGFEQQSTRFYPEASMAASTIGFVGKNDLGENKGYFGLEGFYDRQLRGKAGYGTYITDAFGRPILAKINKNSGQIDGRSLVLSIDRAVQFMVEKKLKKGIEEYGASSGMVGIMDPKTGSIIAMATLPTFDPRFYKEYDQQLYQNPFISYLYEPGSTFKAIVMAAALDAKAVKPETKCPICEKPVPIGEYEIRTWNNQYQKNITMLEVIQHSDNTGMVYAGRVLGMEKMLEYFKKFGIGEVSGIDLQGEVSLSIKPLDQWYPIDMATATFGQGISITPIQLLVAFSAIANNGVRMEPHVVSQVETSDKQAIPIPSRIIDRPISSQTAKVMTEILVNAVDKGEAKWVKPKGYRVAGKTGTAQIPIAGHYDPHKTIASFIGFAPADDPKFAMLVIVDRPTTSIYGAETAAPIFFDIAQDLFSYYRIPPTE